MRLTLHARKPRILLRKLDERAIIEHMRASIAIDHMDRRELRALVPRLKLKAMPFNRDETLMTLPYTKRAKSTQEHQMDNEKTPDQRFISERMAARAEKEFQHDVTAGRNILTGKIGPVIYALRKEKVVTLAMLEAATGFNIGNLSKIERGMRPVSAEELDAIASALDTTAQHIFSVARERHE